MPGKRTYGPWCRKVTTRVDATTTLEETEYLNIEKAVARLHEAMAERGDGGLRGWLDVALNGWGGDE